jgi:hypothetical protein
VEVGVTYKVRGKGRDLNIDLSFEFLADDKLLKMLYSIDTSVIT